MKNDQTAPRVCSKCNEIVNTSETLWANRSRKMMPVSCIKMLGWLSFGSGIFLLGLMSWLCVWVYQAISRSGEPGAGTEI